jgi:(R,R)-butanediol dehydrogenase / meso-butanediol dehydrogenase / diacetyl reductase
VVDPTAEPLAEAVDKATKGRGADVVVDAVGTLLPDALSCLVKGGRALVFGLDASATVDVRPSLIAERELRVEGVYITRGTFPLALELLNQRGEVFAPLLTHDFSLDAISDGVDAMRSAEAVKALVLP